MPNFWCYAAVLVVLSDARDHSDKLCLLIDAKYSGFFRSEMLPDLFSGIVTGCW